MQQTRNHPADRKGRAPAMRNLVEWIVDADRKFRVTQSRIDRMSDRF
jgi:hypothetical protein